MLPWEAALGTVAFWLFGPGRHEGTRFTLRRSRGKVWVHAGETRIPPAVRSSAFLPTRVLLLLVFMLLWISQMEGAGLQFADPTVDHSWSLRVGRGLCMSLDLWVSVRGPPGRAGAARSGRAAGSGRAAQRGWGQGALGPRGRCFRVDAPSLT